MQQDRYSRENRSYSRFAENKRDAFRNQKRKDQLQKLFAQKRKQFANLSTRESFSQQFKQDRIENRLKQDELRKLQSHAFDNHFEENTLKRSISLTGVTYNWGPNIFSRQTKPQKEKQTDIFKIKQQMVNHQPPINQNNSKSNENQLSPSILETPKFNLSGSHHSNKSPKDQSSNRKNYHMKNHSPKNKQTNQIQSFSPIQQSSQPQNQLSAIYNAQESQIVSQSSRMQSQHTYDHHFSNTNIIEDFKLNDTFQNQKISRNILGINYINILSNEKILENLDQQNEFLKQMANFKQNLAVRIISPMQEQLPNSMQSPDNSRQYLSKLPSPDQSYPIVNQHYLPRNHNPIVNYNPKIINNFEQIKQIKKKEPFKIQKKQDKFKDINLHQEENQFKNVFKKKKVNQTKFQQAKPQENVPNFSPKFINWGKVIKKHSKYAVLDKVLGKGTYGSVYLGVNIETGQRVAVKKIIVKKAKHFIEVSCMKQIQHQNIVTLYDYLLQEKEQQCYLFMEYCQINLREKLEKLRGQKKSLVYQAKIKINFIQQLINGMNQLNEKGYIHRDLKFQNILVKNDSIIKICDFGLCRQVNKKLEVESVRCGTPYTMAPEIFFHPKNIEQNPTYTEKADIFSLAVIMHEIIYNIHPFDYQEDKLKKLQRFERKKTKFMAKFLSEEWNINISWIEDIIQGGLKKLEDRISWEELMKIYRNRVKYSVQIKQKPNENNEIKKQFTKKENPQQKNQSLFKKKPTFKETQAKPIEVQPLPKINKPNYPKFDKPKKLSNPEEKLFNLLKEKQRISAKNKYQQQHNILQKENPQSAGKSKYVPKINLNRKIEIKLDIEKQEIEFKNIQKDCKKQETKNVIKSSIEKQDEKVIKNEYPASVIKQGQKFELKERMQTKNLLFLILILNIVMAIGFVVFNFNQNSVSSVEAEKSPVN